MNTHPAAEVYPYIVRLFVDVDPSSQPVAIGCVLFERGAEQSTVWFAHPGPFDQPSEAFVQLLGEYAERFGTHYRLF